MLSGRLYNTFKTVKFSELKIVLCAKLLQRTCPKMATTSAVCKVMALSPICAQCLFSAHQKQHTNNRK